MNPSDAGVSIGDSLVIKDSVLGEVLVVVTDIKGIMIKYENEVIQFEATAPVDYFVRRIVHRC